MYRNFLKSKKIKQSGQHDGAAVSTVATQIEGCRFASGLGSHCVEFAIFLVQSLFTAVYWDGLHTWSAAPLQPGKREMRVKKLKSGWLQGSQVY